MGLSARFLWLVLPCAALAFIACDDAPSATDGGVAVARIFPRFDPAPDPMDFGAVPFPDDLYLDDLGRVALGELPGEAEAIPADFPDSLRAALLDLDGFSANAPVFFYFPPDSLRADSLPASASESTREDSTVFLVDVDPASPTAFDRVPVTVDWQPALGQLALRPYTGHPLAAGRRYAAVVTTSVLDDLGEPIGPSARFLSVRDAAVRPADELMAEAYDRYDPVLGSLGGIGTPRSAVAGLAVFTVQSIAPDMRDARATIWAGDAPMVGLDQVVRNGVELDALLGTPDPAVLGLDAEGGVVHDQIEWLIQGHFDAPWFLSAEAGVHGRLTRDDSGLVTTRTERVPFTLTLPAGDLDRARVAIFQHGLGSERSTMIGVADALAGAGWAVLAIDIPFHGMRFPGAPDASHNYGATEGPDGFGDRTGDEVYLEYLGVVDDAGEFPAFHPNYPRDVFRQSVFDLMSAVRVLREGDWSEVTAVAELALLDFSAEPVAFIGVSLGGIVGTVFIASEPEVGAAVLNVTGGDLTALVERSASFSDLFLPILLPKLGVNPTELDSVAYAAVFHPEVAITQTLLDRGDSMTFAPLIRQRDMQVLFQLAEHDETMPNSATEALARAAGAPLIDAEPVFTDLEVGSSPARENVDGATTRVTRGLYRFAPATHGLLMNRGGSQRVEHPPDPPFVSVEPVAVDNPIDEAMQQVVRFLETWQAGPAEIVAPTP